MKPTIIWELPYITVLGCRDVPVAECAPGLLIAGRVKSEGAGIYDRTGRSTVANKSQGGVELPPKPQNLSLMNGLLRSTSRKASGEIRSSRHTDCLDY